MTTQIYFTNYQKKNLNTNQQEKFQDLNFQLDNISSDWSMGQKSGNEE